MTYPDPMSEDTPLPGELLLTKLEELRKRLNKSGVERTAGLREMMGDDCPYYWKSLNVFLKRDYEEIRNIINEASLLLKQCEEEPDCGRQKG